MLDEEETMMIACPKCKSEIDVEKEGLKEGELLSCLECECDFEVASVEPLKLTKVSDEEDADKENE
jgi:lysine biosynthesis protein LysW